MKNLVSILMGSQSDMVTVNDACAVLTEFKVPFEVRVLSAHRTPKELVEYVEGAEAKGTKVFIAAAGGSAALAGVVAAHTIMPVIGIPIETRTMGGLDSLLSTVQMPGGVPVASMAIGSAGAKNAGLYAAAILSVQDKELQRALREYRARMRKKILETRV